MPQVIAHCLESSSRTKDVTVDGNATFESLMLNEVILNGLRDSGFKKPSPIQVKAIPIGRCGLDMIVKSKSGTGKTLVYSIIALETITVEKHQTQVLILSPTREIAVQIQEVLTSIGNRFKGLKTECFIGGLPFVEDKEKCKNCHIAVGAPGRVKHLIREGILKLNSVQLLVLDEVDKLTESTFISDINEIFNSLPDRKQIITTSATYPKNLYNFLSKYMLSPTYIEIENDTPLLLGLKQFVKIIKPYTSVVQEIQFKNEDILNLLSTISFTQCLIFTNYQTRAESISNFLNKKGLCSMYISAAQSQIQRLKTVKDLKNFKCKILLSTDLTARGIDAAKVDLVINYDVPTDAMTYLHRMGRAGRYGSSGICIDFVSSGAVLQHWQNIIGLIGGCSLGIPKLPKFNGTVLDLFKVNITAEDCIFGTMSNKYTPDLNISIKNNILDLKQRKNGPAILTEQFNKSTNINGDTCSLATNFELRHNQTQGQIRNHSTEVNLHSKPVDDNVHTYCDSDKSTLLNPVSLDNLEVNMKFSGNTSVDSTSKEISSFNYPKEYLACASNNQALDDYKSITGCESQLSENTYFDIAINDLTHTSEKAVYHKNKALLQVTQILSCDKPIDLLKLDLYDLHFYLKTMKIYEKHLINKIKEDTKSRSIIELLKDVNEFSCTQEIARDFIGEIKDENNIERIFKVAYQYATGSNCRHWSSYFSNYELSRFQNLCLMGKTSEINIPEVDDNVKSFMCGTDESNEYNMKHEFSDEQFNNHFETGIDSDACNPKFTKWPSIENSADRPGLFSENSNYEHLSLYFNECSERLWQTGLSFESIEDFDNWFYHEWQAQVVSVRDYIQQNIYILEMSNYQKIIFSKNKK